jgi:proline iminopeptidase
MKHLSRVAVITLLAAGLIFPAQAQDRAFRAEVDCLMLSGSSGNARPGEFSPYLSFHHVWTPDLNYGQFRSNGIDLHYETEGVGEETVIVVHGGPGLPHEYFHPGLSNLGKYVRLVYFDRRADMLSTRSGHELATLEEMAEDVDALRQSLKLGRVTLLGHSFGGAIALTYALKYPERVKRLILVSTSGMIESPSEVEKRLVKALTPKELAAFNATEGIRGSGSPCDGVRHRYRVLYPKYFFKSPDARSIDRGAYSVYFDMLARKLLVAGSSGGFDARDRLGSIKAPTLVIGGRYDLVTPLNHSGELTKGLPQAKLVVLERSGHFPFMEENYLFTEWVRKFIAATAGGADDVATESASADGLALDR